MSKQINLSVLIAMAAASPADEFSSVIGEGMNAELREAIEVQMKESRKNATVAAATTVIELIGAAKETTEMEVSRIRQARRQESEAKNRLEDIEKATAFGNETGNFVPLAVVVCGDYKYRSAAYANPQVISKVPEDWKPKSAKAETSTAGKKATAK